LSTSCIVFVWTYILSNTLLLYKRGKHTYPTKFNKENTSLVVLCSIISFSHSFINYLWSEDIFFPFFGLYIFSDRLSLFLTNTSACFLFCIEEYTAFFFCLVLFYLFFLKCSQWRVNTVPIKEMLLLYVKRPLLNNNQEKIWHHCLMYVTLIIWCFFWCFLFIYLFVHSFFLLLFII
jgi:hypothetical protein